MVVYLITIGVIMSIKNAARMALAQGIKDYPMSASQLIPREEPKYLSLNELATSIRQDSDNQDPILREIELTAMLKLLQQLSDTGLTRIPAIVHGAVLAEKERVAILADKASKV
jgi:hypothetical protein